MTTALLDISIILVLTLINGFFALSELAIVSARRERLQPMAEDGNRGAQLALEMADDPTALLSTVQVGITLVGILAGAFGGARLSSLLAPVLEPALGRYSQTVSFILVVTVITYLSVVIGELVPKRLALRNPERVAAFVAPVMSVISRIARPVVSILALSTDGVLRLLGVDSEEAASPVTEDEIKLLVEQGAQAGIFDVAERDMVEGIFRLGDRQMRSLMTPRTEIVWLDVNDSIEQIQATVRESNHTQFPVCKEELDYVLGVVRSKDLLSPVAGK
ncbi:MAG: hemolysin family protein [Chloroflexota bacterium]